MKYLLSLLFSLFYLLGHSQTQPTGFPTQFNTGWQQWGYQQSLQGTIIAKRDTLGWLPRFTGTTIVRPQDRDMYFYDSAILAWKRLWNNKDTLTSFTLSLGDSSEAVATTKWVKQQVFNSGVGATNNVNIGSGFRPVNAITQEMRTYFAGFGTRLDTVANANGITWSSDTARVTGLPTYFYVDSLPSDNISNTALTANGNYAQNWSNKQWYVDSIGGQFLFRMGGIGSTGTRRKEFRINWGGPSFGDNLDGYNILASIKKADLSADSLTMGLTSSGAGVLSMGTYDVATSANNTFISYSTLGLININARDSIWIKGAVPAATADSILGVLFRSENGRSKIVKIPLPAAGGGATLNNIGGGFRWVATTGGNIKTAYNSNTILWDSTSNTNGLTPKVDTSVIATQYDLTQISGSPGGSNTQVQFNDGGVFGGDDGFTFSKLINKITIDSVRSVRLQSDSIYSGIMPSYSPDSMYFFGDSYVVGAVASPATLRWTTLLAKLFNLVEKNMGVSGSTLMKRTPVDPYGTSNMIDRLGEIPFYGALKGWIVVAYGFNDMGYNGANYTPANFRIDYQTVVDTIIARGWPAHKVIIVAPYYASASTYSAYATLTGTPSNTRQRHLEFIDTANAVATFNGTRFVSPFNAQVANDSTLLLSSDNIHPYNWGHAIIAQSVYSSIVDTVHRNGQTLAINGNSEFQDVFLRNQDTVATYSYVLGLSAEGKIGVFNQNKIVRAMSVFESQAGNINMNGKGYFGGVLNSDGGEIETVQVNGGFKANFIRANGSLPGGMVDSAVEIAMINPITGYIGVENRSTSSALNLSVNGLGGAIMLGALFSSGSNIVQMTGNSSVNGRLRVGDHGTPTVTLEVANTDAMLLPAGTSVQRPTGVGGYIRSNIDSSYIPEVYDNTAWRLLATREWVRANFGGGAVTIYNGDGALSGNRTLTGSNNSLTFDGIFNFRVNSNSILQSKAGGGATYSTSVIGASNFQQFGYTPVPTVYSKGSAIIIDTNNNVGLGTSALTTMPLYATGVNAVANNLMVGGSQFDGITTVTSNTTLDLTKYYVRIDASGGNVTVTLPAASTGFGAALGIHYVFKRLDNSGNSITVTRAGSDTIDGGTSITLTAQYEVKEIICSSSSTWDVR